MEVLRRRFPNSPAMGDGQHLRVWTHSFFRLGESRLVQTGADCPSQRSVLRDFCSGDSDAHRAFGPRGLLLCAVPDAGAALALTAELACHFLLKTPTCTSLHQRPQPYERREPTGNG